MKKNTLLACLAFALGASSITFAQTQQDRKKITKNYNLLKTSVLSEEVAASAKENYNRAIRMAEKKNWPKEINFEDGGFGELVGITEENIPLYYRTYNKGGVSTIHADKVHTGGDAGLDLNGQDMIVGVWDGGSVRISHELFEGRALKLDGNSGLQSHGTHVTGTVIGSATVNEGNAIGVAPEATAHTYDWNNDYQEMIEEAEEGLLVSNHSYGLATIDNSGNPILPPSYFGQYQQQARTMDNMLHDLEYYLPVYAAGNDRSYYNLINPGKGGYDLLTGEAVAKNNLVVGSIHELEEYEGPSSVQISSFSNYGPTDDGRVKPDIVAKGSDVYSATANSDSSYTVYGGTSMASPSVAGGVALIQQHANNEFGDYLRSATVRGLIAHTATKAGTEGSPNYRFGWGVLNVEKAAEVISNHGESSLVRELVLEENQEYLITVNASELEDLTATIAWTDLPGVVSNATDDRKPILVNDLDIRIIEVDGEKYYPYTLNAEHPTFYTTTGDNKVDNIEKIEVPDPEGEYIIQVSHKGSLEGGDQKFSMILSGITEPNLIFETYENNPELCEAELDEVEMELLVQSVNAVENTIVTIEGAPEGLDVTLDDSDIANGKVMLNVVGLEALGVDTYTFELKAVNGSDEAMLYPTITITEDNFEGVNLVSPENGKDEIGLYTTFKWEEYPSNRVQSYTIELALDEDFEDIVYVGEDITNTQYTYTQLERNKDYYWRVKAVGICGEGEYGEVFAFHTYNLSVDEFDTDEFAVYPNPATNQVNIDAPTQIKEVKVMNILGQEVMTLLPDANHVQIDISALSSGNYFLQISDINTTTVKKLIKK